MKALLTSIVVRELEKCLKIWMGIKTELLVTVILIWTTYHLKLTKSSNPFLICLKKTKRKRRIWKNLRMMYKNSHCKLPWLIEAYYSKREKLKVQSLMKLPINLSSTITPRS